ncbi:pyridoxamine 5'-phosphate oxidase family protein [Desulfoluna spongiiphila]|uniref:pyridoxamine 5'-phosphate oxidase family protein n=1 Tax=Desulfoluna spongiiphila TaxID=419481 RepID=UPI001D029ED8|nr:pyridoxamine 5'-phosphate oxidase family protein [Desulfoluna spongiiphila]
MDKTSENAAGLLHRAHIMTLATACDGKPWAAAVYYVAYKGNLYFFSSPDARHILEGKGEAAAATVHENPFHFGQIEGLQMEGVITKAGLTPRAMGAFSRYVKRFPFLKDLFAPQHLGSLAGFLAAGKPKWYRFTPETALYLDNSEGFGHRVEVNPDALFPQEE